MASTHLHELQPNNPTHHPSCLFVAADSTHPLGLASLSHTRAPPSPLLEQNHPLPLLDPVSDESSPQQTGAQNDGTCQRNDQNSAYCDLQIDAPSEQACSQKVQQPPSTSSVDSTKDRETFSSSTVATITMDADLSASTKENRFVSSCSCTEVKGVAEAMAARLLKQAMDNVQSQVLCALQQAANQTLEHLRNDAAHRILVAERKAASLEQELSMVRQHALAMLLQLKEDNDSQISEMEKRCMMERRRAQDAEAKLATIQLNLKRVKLDLRKKRDIIEKMQKLVQPVNADYKQAPRMILDTVTCGSNGFEDELHVTHLPSLENCCFPCKQGDAHPAINKETCFSAGKPGSVDEATAREDGSRLSVEAAECEMPKHYGTERYGDASPCDAEDSLLENQSERSVSKSGGIVNYDHIEMVEESNEGSLLETKTVRNDEVADSKHTDCLSSRSEHVETVIPFPSVSQENQADIESRNLGVSCSPIKGIYVRRRARANGENIDNENNNLSMPKHCRNIKECISVETSSQLNSKLQMDNVNVEKMVSLQETSNRIDIIQKIDSAVAESNDSHKSMTHADAFGDDSEVNFSTVKDAGVPLLPVEHARPDYEVATSLTKLALFGQELQNHEKAISSSRMKDVFIKPGRTGLRTKRKGPPFQTKVDFGINKNGHKKSKLQRDDAKASIKSGERSMRTKLEKSTASKSELCGESSRDTRRLLQGARQLLCLAEKKWG